MWCRPQHPAAAAPAEAFLRLAPGVGDGPSDVPPEMCRCLTVSRFLARARSTSTTRHRTNCWGAALNNAGVASSGVVKQISGTMILTATNSYSGGTTMTRGTLSVSKDESLGEAVGGLAFNGGTLQVTGKTMTSMARVITVDAAGVGLDIDDAANTLTVAKPLLGIGLLTKSGEGTLVLTQ
ncbi:hypothetical protein C2U31_09390 [Achromobacter sp. AONIH1]|nr:hypothetical protein C2U31_09390 [Achromobacter sp. AONIH1]